MIRYYWSFDRNIRWENTATSINECVRNASKSMVDSTDKETSVMYLWEVELFLPTFNANEMISMMQEKAREECKDFCEGWLEVISDKQKRQLEVMVNDTVDTSLMSIRQLPKFGKIQRMATFTLPG